MSNEAQGQSKVRRIRRVSGDEVAPMIQEVPPKGTYRGFGSIRGETVDDFHDRMYSIDPLEAMIYEMEVALGQSHNYPAHPTE